MQKPNKPPTGVIRMPSAAEASKGSEMVTSKPTSSLQGVGTTIGQQTGDPAVVGEMGSTIGSQPSAYGSDELDRLHGGGTGHPTADVMSKTQQGKVGGFPDAGAGPGTGRPSGDNTQKQGSKAKPRTPFNGRHYGLK